QWFGWQWFGWQWFGWQWFGWHGGAGAEPRMQRRGAAREWALQYRRRRNAARIHSEVARVVPACRALSADLRLAWLDVFRGLGSQRRSSRHRSVFRHRSRGARQRDLRSSAGPERRLVEPGWARRCLL